MPDAQTLLATRRSVPIPMMAEPGPSNEQITQILTAASRVPDHGKLAPWRFILFRGEAADAIGSALAARAEAIEGGPLSPSRRSYEEGRFRRAPLVIGVVSTARPHFKIPEWEQVLSAGAATMNLMQAAHALGFGANWITEWPAYDEEAKSIMGILPEEKVVGFIYIGSPTEAPSDRPRPDLAAIVSEAPIPTLGG